MNRTAPRLLALLLCATALAGCGTTDIAELTGGKTAAEAAKAQVADAGKPTSDLDSNVRQAQLLRIAGQYDQAVKILSQLMLVASDDARVLNEYGKTLAEEGRASEAVQFLSRATEIQANDWTTYSAMGVAYDQMGDQASARNAYEHALTLKPQEVSVLNNYALSRMLANDPEGARQLIARAASQGGASDPKIARNIALLNELAPSPVSVAAAPEPKPAALASTKPTPEPQQQATAAPVLPVSSAPPTSAPRPLQQPQPQTATATPHPVTSTSTVVMQRVPVDPLAGPVKVAKTAAKPHAPVTVAGAPHAATADATKPDAKGVAIATLPATPAKPAAAKSVSIPPQG